MIYRVHFLPARYGDCIWIEYGEADALHRILIDGGTGGTRHLIKEMIEALPEGERHFELMVVTHIDRDHIEGILTLLEEEELNFTVGDFWFNGWNHLPGNREDEYFGAKQGERLTECILRHKLPWNQAFDGKAVVIPVDEELPEVVLEGGMKLTLLSPQEEGLQRLKPKWEAELIKEGLVPGFGAVPVQEEEGVERFGPPNINQLNKAAFKEDSAEANGSSIAFLAEFDNQRVLFAGDAYPGVVLEGLGQVFPDRAPLTLIKLSHHGSSHNTSPALIEKLDCRRYVISTNGSIYHHPNEETIAWVIKRGGDRPELIFNYTSDDNSVWADTGLQQQHHYSTIYPDSEGIVVDILE